MPNPERIVGHSDLSKVDLVWIPPVKTRPGGTGQLLLGRAPVQTTERSWEANGSSKMR